MDMTNRQKFMWAQVLRRGRAFVRQFVSFRHIVDTFIVFPATGFGILFLAVSLLAGNGSPIIGMTRIFHAAAAQVTIVDDGFLVKECRSKILPPPIQAAPSKLSMSIPTCTAQVTAKLSIGELASYISPFFWVLYGLFVMINVLSFIVFFAAKLRQDWLEIRANLPLAPR
jgi:hypothetical protein